MTGFVTNIEERTLTNDNYREVLFTGPDSQLVVMTLAAGEEIGEESHDLDQFIRVESGSGQAILNSEVHEIRDGFAIVVPKGTLHNIKNTADEPLKLYTLYTAVEHAPGTVHKTKEDSIKDEGH